MATLNRIARKPERRRESAMTDTRHSVGPPRRRRRLVLASAVCPGLALGAVGFPTPVAAQSQSADAPANRWAPPKTPWGDPDLQGILDLPRPSRGRCPALVRRCARSLGMMRSLARRAVAHGRLRTPGFVPAVAVVMLAAAGQAATAAAQTGPVTFTDHIRPIMERTCWNCHGEAAQLSDLDLRTRDGALAGGARGRRLCRATPTGVASTGWWRASINRRCR